MLHPSYTEIMKAVNSEIEEGDEPLVNSRYSIVLATAKRARQIISGKTGIEYSASNKPLSIAVKELYEGNIKIVQDDTEEIDQEEEMEEVLTTE